MGIKSLDVDHVASHLGKSEGIVKFIRAIPHYGTRRRRVLIPTSLLALHKVSQEDFIRGKREQKVKDVIFELASIAYRHLDEGNFLLFQVLLAIGLKN
ncbi:NADH dehydrogenase (ubiquinone) complex I, assembly factor 6 [Armadillidium nasatum]|uniref:NADH dehydrogenase (Ubiquinone) complex I, assembly factor 6 n=1 Tax=Armadillidium nasatum TaxID=96803 RepID=A0A5N5TLB8_9CRUS|nr:NADH dehydrogenase (ubiquinone) complex I, assembly factor 6 [Armadillidium nasatum]